MKPLKLTMTAFGPYKDTEVIDFTELKDNRLFVISGKTGAGKTTIFDGICFALYGSASGEDRSDSKSLRSDFADDEVHTAVELEFELRGRMYRIKRQLGHIKKGNKTPTGERFEFYEKVGDEEIPCVDRQIVTEINKKVEELLGLTRDQFIQIVMLPQGEFRKLLTSDTENKEEILRRIFKTERYTLIAQRLRERKQAAEEDYRGEKQALERYITEITGMIPERDDSELFEILNRDSYNAHQILTGLEQEKDYYEQAAVRHKEEERQAETVFNKKLEEYHKAESLNEEFNKLEEKQRELTGLFEQKQLFAEKEKQLENAERASRLEAYEKQVNDWRKDVSEKEELLQRAKTAFDNAVRMRKEAELYYKQEEKKQVEREETNRKLEQHRDLLPIVEEIAVKRTALEKSYRELKGMEQKLESEKSRQDQLSEVIAKKKAEVKAKEEKVDKLPEKVQRLSEMRDTVRVLQEYLNLLKKREQLVIEGQKIKVDWEKAKHQYETKESAWLNGQAAVLAEHLHAGEPCPVCGSTEHPEKARGKEFIPTKEELEKAKADFNQIDSLYRNAQSEYKIIKNQLNDKAKEVIELQIKVEHAQAAYDQMVQDGKNLSNEVNALEEERQNLAKIREQLQSQEEEIVKLEQQLEQWSNDFQERKTNFASEKAVYEEQLKRVPEELRNVEELKRKITDLQTLKEALEKAWKTAQEKLQQAQQEEVKAKANWENAGKQFKESIGKKDRAEEQFQNALKEAGFADEENYRLAKLPEVVREQLRDEIDRYHSKVESLKLQIKDLKESLKDKTKVDLTALAEELNALKAAFEKAQDLSRQTETYLEQIKKQTEKISDSYAQVAEYEKRLNTVADLYDIIRGQNSKKISFERYLQIEYLEQILVAANERLRKLSNGQFELIRSDRQESRGRQSGLGLDVYDAYTGQTRDVKTLSGGEKFNASLSLALGMSDVIQSFQGGVSIDTMFIDEGFGSLDDEALTKAIDTLIDLQQSGRMIGVISHVPELKNTIPAVLEVYKMKEGYSETKFIIK